jgi:hypothetical protein
VQVGILYLTSDSTHGLVIYVGKIVMSALAMQVQLPTGERISLFCCSLGRRHTSLISNIGLHGSLDSIAAHGYQKLNSVVTPDSESVSGID